MKKFLALILLGFVAFTAAACNVENNVSVTDEDSAYVLDESSVSAEDSKEPEVPETSDETSQPEVSEETDPPATGTTAFEFEVQYSDEIDETTDYIHFVDTTNTAQNWKITVNADENIEVFSFIELDASTALKVGNTLFVYNANENDVPLMLHTYISDATLNRGISYADENGKVVYLALYCDMNTGEPGAREIEIGVIPAGTYEPAITDEIYRWEGNDVFEKYFNDYVKADNKTEWSHIGVSTGKYCDTSYAEYTQFDIYRVDYTGGKQVEYYAIPCGETQFETVYKFQFDDSLVPVWVNPDT